MIAAPNNGTEGSLYHMLKQPPAIPDFPDGVAYQTTQYPDGEDYIRRANLTTAGCDCDTQVLTISIPELMSENNLSNV